MSHDKNQVQIEDLAATEIVGKETMENVSGGLIALLNVAHSQTSTPSLAGSTAALLPAV